MVNDKIIINKRLPKNADIGIRFFKLDRKIRTRDNLISIAKSFHVNSVFWSYIKDRELIKTVQKLGWNFQGTVNSVAYELEHAKTDNNDQPIYNNYNDKKRYIADPQNKHYRLWYIRNIEEWLNMGVYNFQRDEPTGLGPIGDNRRWIIEDAINFFNYTHNHLDSISSKDITFSCNLVWNKGIFSDDTDTLTKYFDFALTEINNREVNAEYLWQSSQSALQRNKKIIYTGALNGYRGLADLETIRRQIAFSYSLGQNIIVPWDQYGGKNQPRIFSTPNELADLFGFVRGIEPYLNDYYEVFAILPKSENLFSHVINFENHENTLAAFMRVKANDIDAPVVLHLIRTSKKTVSTNLILDLSYIFPNSEVSIFFKTKKDYDKAIHEKVIHNAYSDSIINQYHHYSELVRTDTLFQNVKTNKIQIKIPELDPWGIIILKKSQTR